MPNFNHIVTERIKVPIFVRGYFREYSLMLASLMFLQLFFVENAISVNIYSLYIENILRI